jgi:hypothetical protein
MSEAHQFRMDQVRDSRCAVKRLPSFLFAVLLCVSATFAADREPHRMTVTLQPADTSIGWTLSDPLHTVHGTFKLKQGVINYNLDDDSADGLIEVDATSGESGAETPHATDACTRMFWRATAMLSLAFAPPG